MPYEYLSNSPWTAAAGAAGGVADSLSNVSLGVAKLRYQQALQQQRMDLARQRLGFEAQRLGAQVPYYDAGTRLREQQTAIDAAKLKSALGVGEGVRGLMPQPDMSQGPTAENAAALSLGDLYQNAATSAALSGKAEGLILPRNVGANQISYQPMTGSPVASGPTVLAPGHMYQLPGQEPVIAPSLHNVPPGATAIPGPGMQGVQPFTAPGRPAQERMGNVLAEILRMYGQGSLNSPGTNATALDKSIYNYSTNVLGRAQAELGQGTNAPNVSAPPPNLRRYNPATDSFE